MPTLARSQSQPLQVVQPVTLPAAGNTTLATIDVGLVERLVIEVGVITQALDAFIVQARVAGSPNFITVASVALDYSSPVSPLIRVVGTPVTLAAGTTALLIMDVRSFNEIRLQASAAVDGAVATVFASAS